MLARGGRRSFSANKNKEGGAMGSAVEKGRGRGRRSGGRGAEEWTIYSLEALSSAADRGFTPWAPRYSGPVRMKEEKKERERGRKKKRKQNGEMKMRKKIQRGRTPRCCYPPSMPLPFDAYARSSRSILHSFAARSFASSRRLFSPFFSSPSSAVQHQRRRSPKHAGGRDERGSNTRLLQIVPADPWRRRCPSRRR